MKNVQKVWRGISAVHHVGVMVEHAQQMLLSQMTYEAKELDQLQWEREQFGEKQTLAQFKGLTQLNWVY